jgi:hypothetical protein
MPQNIRRRLFGRIVLWDTKGGTIIDLPSRNVLSFGGPSESEEYVRLASGDREVISRSHTAQIPITRREASEVSEVLQKVGCPFKAAFLGINGTDSWMWLEPTKLQVTDPEVSAGQLSEKVLELNTNVFYPAIWEGMSLVEGVPWRGTSQQTRDSNNVLRSKGSIRPGYEGPLWKVPSGASVDLKGESRGISPTSPASIKIEFPVWQSKLSLDSNSNFDAEIISRGWNDNKLRSDSRSLTLPEKTFYVEVRIFSSQGPVSLEVDLLGEGLGVIEGRVAKNCTRVLDPNWPPINLLPDITGPITNELGDNITTESASEITA